MGAKRIATLGILISLSLILGWVEHMIPISVAVPGIKLGLGNIVVVFALYRLDPRQAFALSMAKVLLTALLFGGFSGLVYSAAGAAVSYGVMLVFYARKNVSAIGVSAAGGAAHIAAQVAVAIIITQTAQIWHLLPPMLIAGTLSGTATGAIAQLIINRTDIKGEV